MPKLLFLLFFPFLIFAQTTKIVSGYVQESGSKEYLPGVNVYVNNSNIATTTNNYGFYSLAVPAQSAVELVISGVGYNKIIKHINIDKNLELNVDLVSINILNEVVVSAKKQDERVSDNVQMSKNEIPISQIKKIPAFLGEKDVLKVLQLMPGVQKGSEGQSGLYVRGGGPDQNLIILDDATVYNASHLFGFFSVFNGDALKTVEMTKGGFPAQYGGRLSSVVEMQMKEGNKEKLHGDGGIGLISSRLTLEGPIINNKMSFLISGRRTYADIMAKPLINRQNNGSDTKNTVGYYFYDLNGKLNYDFGRKNKLYLSGYFGVDKFGFSSSSALSSASNYLNWGNATATLRWNHLFNEKLFMNTSLIFTKFHFGLGSNVSTTSNAVTTAYGLNLTSKIQDFSLKTDIDYFLNNHHTLKFGAVATHHKFTPNALAVQVGADSSLTTDPSTYNNEFAAYAQDLWNPTPKIKILYGTRITQFGTSSKNYFRFEPRISASYKINENLAFKGSYAIMNQYIHLLSNTGLGLPTDLWVPSTANVLPQQSQQVAMGLAKDFKDSDITFTWEAFYKKMDHIVAYKENASFLSINTRNTNQSVWEDKVTQGQGKAYGMEFMLQKKIGRFSGWAAYTLSWIKWQFDALNYGQWFYPKYDRRHDISLVGIYDLNKSVTFSGTWVYGTGNAITMPIANYSTFGDKVLNSTTIYNSTDYGPKNSYRAEPYHRLDLSVQFHKKLKNHERTWEISVYNAYSRKNPFFYQTAVETNGNVSTTVLQRVSLFPIIPSISYNFKF